MATVLGQSLQALERRARALEREPATANLRQAVVLPILREAIVEGELAPGFRLSEAELARCLGVSRTPVREALGVLERERLVSTIPRLGAFVRTITEADVDEIYVIREALDVLATRLAVDRITAVGLAQVDEVLALMRAAVERRDSEAYVKELDVFYALIMRLSGNATLQRLHESLLGPVRRLRRISMTREGRMERSFAQAERIARALGERDPAAAEFMREQIVRARENVMEVARHAAAGGDLGE